MAKENLTSNGRAIEKRVEQLNNLMMGGVIVLFIGFAAMFGTIATLVISHFDSSSSSYQELQAQVESQNTKIDDLTNELSRDSQTSTPAK